MGLTVLVRFRPDMGAAREHGIIDTLTEAEAPAVADTAYQGAPAHGGRPQRRRPSRPGLRPLPAALSYQKDVNPA